LNNYYHLCGCGCIGDKCMEKLKDKVVLIVDDEDRNTFALSSYLEASDMKTIIAKDGAEAIRILRNDHTIDIILLDMMMPVMDGYETLAVLEKEESLKRIPVIAVTARAMKGDEEKCMESGAWDYVSKPIALASLLEKIAKWVL
jgi:two-component system chemotaxis sensor kinase CheA